MRRPPTAWPFAFRLAAVLAPLDLLLLLAAFGLGLAAHRGTETTRERVLHPAVGGLAVLGTLALAWTGRLLVGGWRARVALAVARGAAPGWRSAQAERDAGRLIPLLLAVPALLGGAGATGVWPGWAVPVHRWAASFAVGFAAVGVPLIGLGLHAQARRIAELDLTYASPSEAPPRSAGESGS